MWSMQLVDVLTAEEHKLIRGPALSYTWNEGALPPLEKAQKRLGLPLFVAPPVEPSVPKAPTPVKLHKRIIVSVWLFERLSRLLNNVNNYSTIKRL